MVLAAGGYPGSYHKNLPISGLKEAEELPGKIFHAGTRLADDNVTVVTSGGRVLCVSEAQENAYRLAKEIQWQDVYMRSDIAYRAIDREKKS